MNAVLALRRQGLASFTGLLQFPMWPHAPAAALLLVWTALNLAYLSLACPHDLAPDEAHYWHWSRMLDWSYYSKGPLVAWLIRGSCELLGNTMFAVRFPAALCSTALLAGMYMLVVNVWNDRRLALGTMVAIAVLPATAVAATLMTIDAPFLACWCGALVGLNRRWWVFAGVCTALGILAKFNMLLLPFVLIVRSLIRREEWRPLARYLLISSLGGLPILIWNVNHHWVSLRHVFEQAGGNGSNLAPLTFLGGQIGVLLVFGFFVVAAATFRYRNESDSGVSLMWWASVPVWSVFLLASLRTPGQVNWPAASYLGAFVLAAGWIREMQSRRFIRIGLYITFILAALLSVGLRFPSIIRPTIAAALPAPTLMNATPVRKLDPTARLAGWQTLAKELDRLRERHPDAILAGATWNVPGELSFYCAGHPEAYSFGPALTDRHSQYDLWRPNPISDVEVFRGRTFLFVGDRLPEVVAAFDQVDEPITILHSESGVPLARWVVCVCRGYRGFPPRRTPIDF